MIRSTGGMDLELPHVQRRRFARRTTTTRMVGLGTAVPEYPVTQAQIARFSSRVVEESMASPEREQTLAFVEKLYANSGIETRYMSVPDFLADDPKEFEFFPPNWRLEPFPTTGDSMRVYERVSVDLAEEASRRALAQAAVDAEDVTHLVVCSCTGFFAPGPDVLLGMRLGMAPTVQRTIIGFMGCFIGFNGMRMADQIVRSDPDAVVLQVCVDLCGLHWQKTTELKALIGNCLFGDGCAAAVYRAAEHADEGLADVRSTYSAVADDTLDEMRWGIGGFGFSFFLSPEVPAVLAAHTEPFVAGLLGQASVSQDQISSWAVHPGGRKIVEAVRDALALESGDVEHSFNTLRNYGNMSSPTIFFVLESEFRDPQGDGSLVSLGFGPGLSMEGAVLDPVGPRISQQGEFQGAVSRRVPG